MRTPTVLFFACVISILVLSARESDTAAPKQQDAQAIQELRTGKNFIPAKIYSEAEDAKVLAMFRGLRVADISDGMDKAGLQNIGRMTPDIHPLWTNMKTLAHRFAGIAVTVRYVPTNRPPAGL
ncbi:hypothetical protein FJY63_09420, partial [Candidatus Sumerlaeota bacterium]|nr:hypothetical protein [Candidatus Sumerlaeota bacterium]